MLEVQGDEDTAQDMVFSRTFARIHTHSRVLVSSHNSVIDEIFVAINMHVTCFHLIPCYSKTIQYLMIMQTVNELIYGY